LNMYIYYNTMLFYIMSQKMLSINDLLKKFKGPVREIKKRQNLQQS